MLFEGLREFIWVKIDQAASLPGSDGGAVYMGADWARACEAGHVTRSMSRKARRPGNARREEFSRRLDGYIGCYRSVKVKKSLGWKSIRRRRAELGYTA